MDAAPDPDSAVAPPPEEVERSNLSSRKDRRDIVSILLLLIRCRGDPELHLVCGGAITKSCSDTTYDANCRTIRRVWHPDIPAFIASPKKEEDLVTQTNGSETTFGKLSRLFHRLHQKITIRSIAIALEIPMSTLFRMKQDKLDSVITPCSIALKPLKMKKHKVQRVLFACVVKFDRARKPLSPFLWQHSNWWDVVLHFRKAALGLLCMTWNCSKQNTQNRDHFLLISKVIFLFAVCYCLPILHCQPLVNALLTGKLECGHLLNSLLHWEEA